MDNIAEFPIQIHEHMSVNHALEVVKAHNPSDVLIVGWDEDEELFVNSSHMDHFKALWLAEKLKQWVFDSVNRKMEARHND